MRRNEPSSLLPPLPDHPSFQAPKVLMRARISFFKVREQLLPNSDRQNTYMMDNRSNNTNTNTNREGKGEEEEEEEGVFVMRRRSEIDTRAPFKSVKEAVMLFGETVLAAELNSSSSSNKLKIHQKQDVTIKRGHGPTAIGTKTTELQETKQNLHIAREESMLMANCLISLKQELEETKRELQQIKATRDFEQQRINPDIEYLKFVENVMEVGTETHATNNDDEEEEEAMEFQNKPCVKFANPPAFVHVINTEEGYEVLAADSRHPSLMKQKKNKKKKKLTLIPLIGRIFSKKNGVQKGASPKY